jgi:hypothetical protein
MRRGIIAGMYEIECPYCGNVTQVKDGDREAASGNVREALERGERPKLACFKCWCEHEASNLPEPSDN